jgi:hypothetical protein
MLAVMAVGYAGAVIATVHAGLMGLSWLWGMLGCHDSRTCWAAMALEHAGAVMAAGHVGLS